MRLWALSDLHVSHAPNREALTALPSYPDDWLILAGDVTDGFRRLDWCFETLNDRFRQLVWVPGNHELWTRPRAADALRGEALYAKLVEIARRHAVITPEDPYPVFPHPTGEVLIAPLFLLYDYSFRPAHVGAHEVIAWARRDRAMGADEYLLHPDPFPGRADWCAALCAKASARLEAASSHLPKILINHYPLEERLAVLPRVPRFTPWCGTRRTRGWHTRFNARAVVYGHLHIRGTHWIDGVPFQEVSLGYPNQWDQTRSIGNYLHEVVLAPAPASHAAD
ncbi:MAG: metallophosphoesterase [Thiotrichales bacterium]|nr:metallophosphoesterase [Thiotrichales bacterium]